LITRAKIGTLWTTQWRRILPLPFFLLVTSGLIAPPAAKVTPYLITICDERSFVQALAQAGKDDTIQFGCSGTITIRRTLNVTQEITLNGSGQQVILSGDNSLQILIVNSGASLSLSDLTLSGGQTNGLGGAIFNRGALSTLRVTFSGNKHGIVNFGTLTATDNTFADNLGDGIYNSGTLHVSGSLFARNAHGIDNASGEVTVSNSTFSANHAPPSQIGGGIANGGTITIVNSTFSDNRASGGGGALANRYQSKASLQNTIIANGGLDPNCFGTTFDFGHNLQYPGTTCGPTIPVADPKLMPLADNGGPTQTMALADDSPAIGAGDATACRSDAVGGFDQRHAPRFSDSDLTCDIGAFESGAVAPTGTPTANS